MACSVRAIGRTRTRCTLINKLGKLDKVGLDLHWGQVYIVTSGKSPLYPGACDGC